MKTINKLPIALMLLGTTLFGTDFLTLKDGNSKYNNFVEKEGKYIGEVVSWDGIAPRDPNIPSGGNPFYYLKIKTEDNSTIDFTFYNGVSFKKQGKTVFETDSCSGYSQVRIHNCVYNVYRKYIKMGSSVEVVVGCGKDSGCYIDSINQISSKKKEKITSEVPVMIGGEPDMDACAIGIVGGLSKNGFLAVRSGPSTKYPMLDKLHNGDSVSMCYTKGKWEGVVYGEDCSGRDAPSSIIPKRKRYEGSCNSGWIYSKWIKTIFD